MNNHIAEICAELAPYRVMIAIDEILDYYTTDAALNDIEGALSNLLQNLRTSEVLAKANRDNGIG
jgi:hypothetical protein